MIAWSDDGPAFAVPDGAVDVYQSIQRLEPGAWVTAHTHEGPESGVVIAGTIARHEGAITRAFATGNPGSHVAEAITLHVVTAGSPFSTPCACATAPPPAPGSSNPARSIVRQMRFPVASLRARHARIAVTAELALAPEDGLPIVLTVLAGRVATGGAAIASPSFAILRTTQTIVPIDDRADVLLTRFSEGEIAQPATE